MKTDFESIRTLLLKLLSRLVLVQFSISPETQATHSERTEWLQNRER
jgi:hypothetical protein